MKSCKILMLSFFMVSALFAKAQNPVGKWKVISDIVTYEGSTYDTHKALLQVRPCAAKIFFEINTDGTFRKNTSTCGCDESYRKIQAKLYSETKWKKVGNKIYISTLDDFSVGQVYIVSFSGDKMIWEGTEGQGTTTYQRI